MEQIFFIDGLDCANCAAKLERHLNEIPYFDQVIIDFMAKKLILRAKDENNMKNGIAVMSVIINQIEPDAVISEKEEKASSDST